AIPVVPLYISLLYKVMKAKGIHEGTIEQMQRLFADRLYNGDEITLDEKGRIRVDDWEMRADVQAEVADLWGQITTENLEELADIAGNREDDLNVFGFNVDAVDYEKEREGVVAIPSMQEN